MKNDPDSFPEVSTFIINRSNRLVIAKIGTEIIKIQPESQKLFNLPKNERNSFSEKVVFAGRKNDSSIDYFYSSYWRIPSGKKTLCIIDYDSQYELYKLTEILL